MLKIASWNVNSITVRLDRVVRFLEREQPDILCLQELKCIDEKFPYDSVKASGYHATVYGQKTYNGVAILSKEVPTDVVRGFTNGDSDDAARLLVATVSGVRVYCCYVPNGQEVGAEKYHYKLNWYQKLTRLIKATSKPGEHIVVAGDFNVAPEDRDVHDPDLWRGKILCSDQERACLKELMALGLQDTFRKHHADTGLFSWWDYRNLSFPKNQGLRIDLILASESLLPLCRTAKIDREERKGEKPSDHVPVIAEFAV